MNPSRFGRLLSAAALVAAAALVSVPAQAGPYSSLVVFGDSLSDSGNNYLAGLYAPAQVVTGNSYIPSFTYAAAPGYPFGVYSNGLVWATDFASMIGVSLAPSLAGGGDFAFGGATTGGPVAFPYSLTAQAGQYLAGIGGVAASSALYVVAGGGNNARDALAAVAGGADLFGTAASFAAAFANDIGAIVDQLQAAGARHIIVWDTPDLGRAPAVTAAGGASSFAGAFIATAMNHALALRLAGESDVAMFDLYGLTDALADDPSAHGFTNATDACGAVAGADCSKYVYWDGIHPTAAGHLAIAGAMYQLAVPVPEPDTCVLLAFGLVAVAWTARRRAKAGAAA